MKKYFLKCAFVFGFVVLIFIFWPRPVQHALNSSKAEKTLSFSNVSLPNKNIQGDNPQPSSEAATSLTNQIHENATSDDPQKKLAKAIEEQNIPVDFYGKVIDQAGYSIIGVHIVLSVRQWHSDPAGTTYPKFDCITDSDGRFEWTSEKGDALTVETIAKDGYRLSPKTYLGYSPSSGSFENPVVFKMWKEGAKEPLIDGSHVFGIDSGKTYTLDLINGKKIEGEVKGDLVVSITRPSGVKPRDKYPWSFSIEAIGGGLLESDDEFMYLAPESGYEPKIEMQFDPSDSKWVGVVKKQFFIRSRNGQVYGRVQVEVDSIYNVHSAIQINYAINPSGSQNLEPQ